MSTITTTTNANPFRYPAQTRMDVDSRNGNLWVVVINSSGAYEFWRSTDKGSTWTLQTTITRANVTQHGSIYIDRRGNLHWCYITNETSQDKLFYRRLTIDSLTWGAELQVTAINNGGVANSTIQGGDLVAVLSGSTHYIAIAVGKTIDTRIGCTLYGVTVNQSSKAQTVNNNIFKGSRQWLYTASGAIRPSIDFEHYGDGTSSDAAHLWVAFGRTKLYVVKLSWSSGAWTGPTSAALVTTGVFTAQESICGRWDGSRFMVAIGHYDATDQVKLYQRAVSNSGGVGPELLTPSHPAGVIRSCTMAYSSTSNNDYYRVYAVGTSSDIVYWCEYNRSADTWTSWTQVTATAVLGATNYGVRRNYAVISRFNVYTAHAGTPNTLAHNPGSYPSVPSTPTWNAASGNSGEARDVATSLLLDWDFNDSDPGDTQSAYALSRQIGAGTVQYFRASDATWQATEQKNTTATSSRTLASGWGVDGDAAHTYKVKVWDSGDLASGYSDGFTVIPSALVNPTVSSPTAGQVITGPVLTVTWTVTEQSAFRVTIVPNPNPDSVTLFDSGWVTDTATSYEVPYALANSSAYTVSLQTRNNEGLASNIVTRNITTSFTPPNTPTLVNTAQAALGVIRTVITNPGGGIAVSYQDLYRRKVGDTDDGIRVAAGLATGATYDDFTAVSGVAYQYLARAYGVNGTTKDSAWTT